MARARDTLLGAKHRRKRPLQRWRVTCLFRDSNERPNRPLRVRWEPVTSVRYRDEILHPLVRPFIAAMGTESRECVGHIGKTDYKPLYVARHPPGAPASLTEGMGITATTSDQRYYCQHALPLSSMHFN
ncbi:hypothetical protein AVEN_165787-1 [Araneus ventricosus]|uniref:Uncharacterized protein n=1 Tax=Araneus ventricosus TaxID=182803 RepID=A0A4Y2NU40_ARAVE|nr:hypothetical protein AVEN_165787-1 [Araneus ventricosus]